jgi:hypothetical protein
MLPVARPLAGGGVGTLAQLGGALGVGLLPAGLGLLGLEVDGLGARAQVQPRPIDAGSPMRATVAGSGQIVRPRRVGTGAIRLVALARKDLTVQARPPGAGHRAGQREDDPTPRGRLGVAPGGVDQPRVRRPSVQRDLGRRAVIVVQDETADRGHVP